MPRSLENTYTNLPSDNKHAPVPDNKHAPENAVPMTEQA